MGEKRGGGAGGGPGRGGSPNSRSFFTRSPSARTSISNNPRHVVSCGLLVVVLLSVTWVFLSLAEEVGGTGPTSVGLACRTMLLVRLPAAAILSGLGETPNAYLKASPRLLRLGPAPVGAAAAARPSLSPLDELDDMDVREEKPARFPTRPKSLEKLPLGSSLLLSLAASVAKASSPPSSSPPPNGRSFSRRMTWS